MQNKELAEVIKTLAVRAVNAQKPVTISKGTVETTNPPTFIIDGLELDEDFVPNASDIDLQEGEPFYFVRQVGAKYFVAIPKQTHILEKLEQLEKRVATLEKGSETP